MKTDTSKSLLDRLRKDSSAADWEVFCGIYSPLIERHLLRNSLNQTDVDDIVQDVLSRVFVALPSFSHNGRQGAFRNWLGKIVVQQLWQHAKHAAKQPHSRPLNPSEEYEARATAELEAIWQAEHDQHVLTKLLELIRPEFTEGTWRAFVSVAVEGQSVADAAKHLETTANAVMIAKSRVLTRLRCLGRELIENL